jgi:hypothetical protein
LGGRVDWEGIVVEDVLGGSNLCVVVVVLQVVFILLYRNLTVAFLCWVGWLEVWNDGIRERRFPVYGNFPVFARLMGGDVKEVYLVVCPAFCRELEFRVCCVEVLYYVLQVCVGGVRQLIYRLHVGSIL